MNSATFVAAHRFYLTVCADFGKEMSESICGLGLLFEEEGPVGARSVVLHDYDILCMTSGPDYSRPSEVDEDILQWSDGAVSTICWRRHTFSFSHRRPHT